MAKEKRIKVKRIYIRVEDNVYSAFNDYIKENNITKNKVVEDFLKTLLKDRLGK